MSFYFKCVNICMFTNEILTSKYDCAQIEANKTPNLNSYILDRILLWSNYQEYCTCL